MVSVKDMKLNMNIHVANHPLSRLFFLIMLLVPLHLWAGPLLLGTGDIVKITVYGQSDLTTITRISESGRITFPLVGDVKIGGLTTAQAERDIASLLEQKGLVKNAQVNIFLEQRGQTLANSVTILGQVSRPGKYPLQDVSVDGVQTLIDLMAMAGGTGVDAADHLLLLKKDGSAQKKIRVDLVKLLREGRLEYNYVLGDGDIVLIPESEVFYIYGQVQRPGRYRLERNMTVMQAISVSSGITDRGSETGIVLKRHTEKGIQSFTADLAHELQANDVIYVKESLF